MKATYRLYRRGEYFYIENAKTRKQESLGTSDRQEAMRLLAAKNEAVNSSELTLALGKTYLSVIDPDMATRKWTLAINTVVQRGGQSTQERARRALLGRAFDSIRDKVIMETTSTDFLAVLADGKQSTLHYLKLLHSCAMDFGWLAGHPILAKRCWPKVEPKPKRAITWDEHCQIVTAEKGERRLYYEILWETGASQSDAAHFSSNSVDWNARTLVYDREKTGQKASIAIGTRLELILRQLPTDGLLFPRISQLSSSDRAAEFYRRCKILEIAGVSLHSYRYAWAERAYRAGYPERFAQAALGHESRAIHHGYARQAKVQCPALEDYERKAIKFDAAAIETNAA
jgi:integrase